MSYDEALVQRVRKALGRQPSLTQREMFGGVAFVIRGNMAVGVSGRDLIVRVGPEAHETALGEPHVRPFDLAPGKPPRGWVLIGPAALKTPTQVKRWVERGVVFARSLPAK